MNVLHNARCAFGTCAAVAVLAGCSAGSSQSTFAPSGLARSGASTGYSNARPLPHAVHYYLVQLDTPSGDDSDANGINDRGWVNGSINVPGGKLKPRFG
jgi:hypothetical protein